MYVNQTESTSFLNEIWSKVDRKAAKSAVVLLALTAIAIYVMCAGNKGPNALWDLDKTELINNIQIISTIGVSGAILIPALSIFKNCIAEVWKMELPDHPPTEPSK
jgi:hypothetical protein